MRLQFKGGSEIVIFFIDRDNKKAKLASSKTNYTIKDILWKQLFDKGKETTQDRITSKLSDTEFKKAIQLAMAKYGYILQEK